MRWIALNVLLSLIRWIAVYSLDSVIRPLYIRAQAFFSFRTLSVECRKTKGKHHSQSTATNHEQPMKTKEIVAWEPKKNLGKVDTHK